VEPFIVQARDEVVALLAAERETLKAARLKELADRQAARQALEKVIQTTRRDELARRTRHRRLIFPEAQSWLRETRSSQRGAEQFCSLEKNIRLCTTQQGLWQVDYMIIRRSNDRGHASYGWLQTWASSFSFADYYDPRWMGSSAACE
jgi:hypothetical protein